MRSSKGRLNLSVWFFAAEWSKMVHDFTFTDPPHHQQSLTSFQDRSSNHNVLQVDKERLGEEKVDGTNKSTRPVFFWHFTLR